MIVFESVIFSTKSAIPLAIAPVELKPINKQGYVKALTYEEETDKM
jgi:hypothetical protein